MKYETISGLITIFISSCITFSTFALGAFQTLLWLMLILMGADVIIGFLGAVARKDIRVATLLSGIPRKLLQFSFFLVAVIVDQILIVLTVNGVPIPLGEYTLAVAVCIWLIVSELLSIIETMILSGVTIPPGFVEIVEWLSKYFRVFPEDETLGEEETKEETQGEE